MKYIKFLSLVFLGLLLSCSGKRNIDWAKRGPPSPTIDTKPGNGGIDKPPRVVSVGGFEDLRDLNVLRGGVHIFLEGVQPVQVGYYLYSNSSVVFDIDSQTSIGSAKCVDDSALRYPDCHNLIITLIFPEAKSPINIGVYKSSDIELSGRYNKKEIFRPWLRGFHTTTKFFVGDTFFDFSDRLTFYKVIGDDKFSSEAFYIYSAQQEIIGEISRNISTVFSSLLPIQHLGKSIDFKVITDSFSNDGIENKTTVLGARVVDLQTNTVSEGEIKIAPILKSAP